MLKNYIVELERTFRMTSKKKMVSTAKYGVTSAGLGGAMTAILVYFFPNMLEIQAALQIIFTVAVNLALVKSGIISED